jgi:hypothetical protein
MRARRLAAKQLLHQNHTKILIGRRLPPTTDERGSILTLARGCWPQLGDAMTFKEHDAHVGYSIFDTYEECYDYNENACFIAATRADAIFFAENAFGDMRGRRIEPVHFANVMDDFGASGEYAMELEAYARFRHVADLNGLEFHAQPHELNDTLIVVTTNAALLDDDD